MPEYKITLDSGAVYNIKSPQEETEADLVHFAQETEQKEKFDAEERAKNTGLVSGFKHSFGQTDERVARGISALVKGTGLGIDTSRLDKYAEEEERAAYIKPEHRAPDITAVEKKFADPNASFLDKAGTAWDAVATGTGEVVGGFVPAVVAGRLAPLARLSAAPVAGGTLALTQHLPEAAGAADAAHQEKIAAGLAPEGSTPDYNAAALLGATAANTALDIFAVSKSVPLVAKLMGFGGKAVQKEASKALVQQGYTAATLSGIARGVGVEVPQEVAQGIINRAAAGQSLTSPEAVQEMIYTAKQTAISMPLLGGMSGAHSKYSADRDAAIAKAKVDEAEKIRIAAEQAQIKKDNIAKQALAKEAALAAVGEKWGRADLKPDDRLKLDEILANFSWPDGTPDLEYRADPTLREFFDKVSEDEKVAEKLKNRENLYGVSEVERVKDPRFEVDEETRLKRFKYGLDTEDLRYFDTATAEELNNLLSDPDVARLSPGTLEALKTLAAEKTEEEQATSTDPVGLYPRMEKRAAERSLERERGDAETKRFSELDTDGQVKESIVDRDYFDPESDEWKAKNAEILETYYNPATREGRGEIEEPAKGTLQARREGAWWILKGQMIGTGLKEETLKEIVKDPQNFTDTGFSVEEDNMRVFPPADWNKKGVQVKRIKKALEIGAEADRKKAEQDAAAAEQAEIDRFNALTVEDQLKEVRATRAGVAQKNPTDSSLIEIDDQIGGLEIKRFASNVGFITKEGKDLTPAGFRTELNTVLGNMRTKPDREMDLDTMTFTEKKFLVDFVDKKLEKLIKESEAVGVYNFYQEHKTSSNNLRGYQALTESSWYKKYQKQEADKRKAEAAKRKAEAVEAAKRAKKAQDAQNRKDKKDQKKKDKVEAERKKDALVKTRVNLIHIRSGIPKGLKEISETEGYEAFAAFEESLTALAEKHVDAGVQITDETRLEKDLGPLVDTLLKKLNVSLDKEDIFSRDPILTIKGKIKANSEEKAKLKADNFEEKDSEVLGLTIENKQLRKVGASLEAILAWRKKVSEGKPATERRVTGAETGPGYTPAEAKKILAPFIHKKRLHNLKVSVVATADKLPDAVKKDIGDLDSTYGVYKDDVIYVVADKHASPAQLMETMAHEAMGHAGFARMFQQNYDNSVTSLFNKLGGLPGITNHAVELEVSEDLAPYIAEFNEAMKGKDRQAQRDAERMLTEEFLAVAQGKEATSSLPLRVWNAIKTHIRRMSNWLRGRGLTNIDKLDATDIHNLLREMREAATGELKAPVSRKALQSRSLLEKAGDSAAREGIAYVHEQHTTTGTAEERKKQEKLADEKPPKVDDSHYKKDDDLANAKTGTNPTAKMKAKAWKDFMIKVETKWFAGESALMHAIRDRIRNSDTSTKDAISKLLSLSQSQVVHGAGLGALVTEWGGLAYDKAMGKWKAVKKKHNLHTLMSEVDELGVEKEISKPLFREIAQLYFEGRRMVAMHNNKRLVETELSDAETALKAVNPNDRAKNTSHYQTLEKNVDDARRRFDKIAEQHLHMTEAEAEAAVTLGEKHDLKPAAAHWDKIRAEVVGIMEEGGLYSKAQAEILISNAGYVPFYRAKAEDEMFVGPQEYIKGLQVNREKKFRGSDMPVNDVFDNMERWIAAEVNRSIRNHSGLKLAKEAVKHKLGTELGPEAEATKHEKWRFHTNRIKLFKEGEVIYYYMKDPLYVDAFTGIDGVNAKSIGALVTAGNFLRQSVVLYPMFSIGQVFQDSFGAMFSSGLKPKYAFKIPLEAVKEMVRTVKGTSAEHAKLKAWGSTGTIDWSAVAARHAAEMETGIKEGHGLWGKWLKPWLERFSMSADNAVRQAVYKLALEQGVSEEVAVEMSFELINFRRRGSYQVAQTMGNYIPFFSAYLQAQHVALKVLTGRGIAGVNLTAEDRKEARQVLAMTTSGTVAMSILFALMNGDDDDYINENAVTRDRRIIIPHTGGWGVPIRQDVFSIPKIMTEHIVLLLNDMAHEDPAKLRKSLHDSVWHSILSPTAVPQGIKPLAELWTNYSFFTGRPIVGQYLRTLNKEMQFTPGTSEISKILGKSGLVSPVHLDHLIRGYFGYAGGLTMWISNEIGKHGAFGPARPSSPTWADAISAIPGNRPFISKTYGTAAKNDFYRLLSEVDRVADSLARLKSDSPEKVADFVADNISLIKMEKAVNTVKKDLAKIRKTIRQVSAKQGMSADEKEQTISRLQAAEQRMMNNVTEKLRNIEGVNEELEWRILPDSAQ